MQGAREAAETSHPREQVSFDLFRIVVKYAVLECVPVDPLLAVENAYRNRGGTFFSYSNKGPCPRRTRVFVCAFNLLLVEYAHGYTRIYIYIYIYIEDLLLVVEVELGVALRLVVRVVQLRHVRVLQRLRNTRTHARARARTHTHTHTHGPSSVSLALEPQWSASEPAPGPG
jgi:hypothetical protein